MDANHSGSSEVGCLWNPPIIGDGAVESRDKNELVDSLLFFVPVLTERRLRECEAALEVSSESPSPTSTKECGWSFGDTYKRVGWGDQLKAWLTSP